MHRQVHQKMGLVAILLAASSTYPVATISNEYLDPRVGMQISPKKKGAMVAPSMLEPMDAP